MSSKTPCPTNKTGTLSPPKLPPKEMMVTRHQSALLHKRQLRQKDRSMKRITQLLKRPSPLKSRSANGTNAKTTPKTSPKNKKVECVQNLKKTMENINKATVVKKNLEHVKIEVASKEYYPNKLKRKLDTKKVMLLPKNNLKIINNKRKLGIPRKDIKSLQTFENLKTHTSSTDSSNLCQQTEKEPKTIWDKTQNPEYSGLTMAEMVRLTEDTEELTDEDLMEILTCPSPVWWEDPPDSCFIEDPIVATTPANLRDYKTKVSNARVSLDEGVVIEDSTESTSFIMNKEFTNNANITTDKKNAKTDNINIPEVEIKQCNEKFIKKRSKLENLLGNIKRKKDNTDEKLLSSVSENKNKVGRGIIIEFNPKLPSEIIELGSDVIVFDDNETNKELNEVKDEKENNCSQKFKRKSKTSSESTDEVLSDLSFQDDEILNDLENMSIPIEPKLPETIRSFENNSASNASPGESHRTVENKCTSNESLETLPHNIGLLSGDNYENIDIEDYLQVTLLKKNANDGIKSAESKINVDKENCEKKLDSCQNSADMINQTEIINEKAIKPTSSNDLREDIPKNPPLLQRIRCPNTNNDLTSPPTSVKSGISDDTRAESSTNTPNEVGRGIIIEFNPKLPSDIIELGSDVIVFDDNETNKEINEVKDEIDTISCTNIQLITDEDLDVFANKVRSDVIGNSKISKSDNTRKCEEFQSNKEVSLDKSSNEEKNEISDNKKQFFLDSQTNEKQKGVQIESSSEFDIQSGVNRENVIEKPIDNILSVTNETNILSNEIEYVTVYKIIPEPENKESVIEMKSEESITKNKKPNSCNFNTNIDMFYKKCKGVNHECNKNKRKINKNSENETTPDNNATHHALIESKDTSNPQTNHDTLLTADNEKDNGDLIFCKSCNPNARSSIVVSDKQSVKYCLKCSSIFDTENCEYCPRKAVTNKTKINSVESKKNNKKRCTTSNAMNGDLAKHFACDLCNFCASTKNKIRRHLSEHSTEDVSKKTWDHSYATRTSVNGNIE